MQSLTAEAPSGALPLVGTWAKARSNGLSVAVAASLAEMQALQGEWTELEALIGPQSVFQSFAQITVWGRHFLSPDQRARSLHIAVVRAGGRAVLILPLVIFRHGPLKIARIAGDPIAQYS